MFGKKRKEEKRGPREVTEQTAPPRAMITVLFFLGGLLFENEHRRSPKGATATVRQSQQSTARRLSILLGEKVVVHPYSKH